MSSVVDLATGVLHRLVFELRYERGELFWDRCGRIARDLANTEGWALQSVDGNGCRIFNEDKNLVFAYTPTKLDLSQSQSQDVPELMPSGEFAAVAEQFADVVVRTLEVDFFPRVGFRAWTLYPTESVDDASSRIGRMAFFSPTAALAGLGEFSYVSHSVVIARPEHVVRVAATPFEQQVRIAPSVIAASRARARTHSKEQRRALLDRMKAQKAIRAFPAMGIMVDLDAYLDEPPYPDEVSVRTFVQRATDDFTMIRSTILSCEG